MSLLFKYCYIGLSTKQKKKCLCAWLMANVELQSTKDRRHFRNSFNTIYFQRILIFESLIILLNMKIYHHPKLFSIPN